MTPDYFDIHSHLNLPQFAGDKAEVISRMREYHIWTNTVGVDLETSREAVELAKLHDGFFATIGLHPADEPSKTFDESLFEGLVSHPKVVAIGECGLDYYHLSGSPDADKARQKAEFEKQIAFAVKHNKPLMIHCRDAHADCLDILRSKKHEHGDKLRGNFHFFTEPIETARKVLEIGFTVSFTGPITFTSELRPVVDFVPLASMMAETDSPFATPLPFRGKRNEPLYIKEIVIKIAEIKRQDLETIQKALVQNSLRFFGI